MSGFLTNFLGWERNNDPADRIERKYMERGRYLGDGLMIDLMINEVEENIRELQYQQRVRRQREALPKADYSWLIDRPKTELSTAERELVTTTCSVIRSDEWQDVLNAFRAQIESCDDASDVLAALQVSVQSVIDSRPASTSSSLWQWLSGGVRHSTVSEPSNTTDTKRRPRTAGDISDLRLRTEPSTCTVSTTLSTNDLPTRRETIVGDFTDIVNPVDVEFCDMA